MRHSFETILYLGDVAVMSLFCSDLRKDGKGKEYSWVLYLERSKPVAGRDQIRHSNSPNTPNSPNMSP